MATSPDYVRLATSSARALAGTALDCLPDAVIVVDTRHKHLPVVLANAAARRCLSPVTDALGLIETSLHRWLGGSSASTIQTMLAVIPPEPTNCVLQWRCAAGEISVKTDIRPLATVPGQQLVMLTFDPAPEPGVTASSTHSPSNAELSPR